MISPTGPHAHRALSALGTRLEWWVHLPPSWPPTPPGILPPKAAYVVDLHTTTLSLLLTAAPPRARWAALCAALSGMLPWVDQHEAGRLAPALLLLLHVWACGGGGFSEGVGGENAGQWEVATVGLGTAADEALLAACGAAVEALVAGVRGVQHPPGALMGF